MCIGESERMVTGGSTIIRSLGGRLTMTMPQNPRASQVASPGTLQSRPGDPAQGHGGRLPLIVTLVLALVVALGTGAAMLLRNGYHPPHVPSQNADQNPAQPEREPGPAFGAGELLGSVETGELALPGESTGIPTTGTTTLSDLEITTAKAPFDTPGQWCLLLTAADIGSVTGFEQRGAPDTALLCTHYLVDDTGYVLVSDIPAAEGVPYLVRGNSAIVFQRDSTACEVSVALNHGGGVLDIDFRGVRSSRVAPCDVAALLAARAFDRLPDA